MRPAAMFSDASGGYVLGLAFGGYVLSLALGG
jgi:hypothetical protein